MIFFCLVRIFGLFYFRTEYVFYEFNFIIERIILTVSYMFEASLILKILTDVSLKKVLLISLIYNIVSLFFMENQTIFFITDLLYIIAIPFYFNKNKRISLGYSLLYIIGTSLYSITMMFGRSYPLLSAFSATWQIIAIIDYKIFILLIFIMKEVFKVGGKGCFLFFDKGKIDKIAQKIGGFILRPFSRFLKNEA